jgi:hypothetical protein
VSPLPAGVLPLPGRGDAVIIDGDRIWTRLATAVYGIRRTSQGTNDPPPINR